MFKNRLSYISFAFSVAGPKYPMRGPLMKPKKWIKFFKDQGVDICMGNCGPIAKDGAYYKTEDKIIMGKKCTTEIVFHEMMHWTGHPKRLNRPSLMAITDIVFGDFSSNYIDEENIALEAGRLMSEKVGWEPTRLTYQDIPQTVFTKGEGKKAFHFLCNEFGV